MRALYPRHMKAQKLVATDTIHAIPVSLLGGVSYLMMRLTDLAVLGLLLLGSIPVGMLGAASVTKLPIPVIRQFLAPTLLLAGLKLLKII